MFTLIFALLLAPGQPKHVRYIAKRLILLDCVFILFCVSTKLCLYEFIAAWYWQGNCLVGKTDSDFKIARFIFEHEVDFLFSQAICIKSTSPQVLD